MTDKDAREREAFEAWIRGCEGHPFAGQFANLMWKAWQARAAFSHPAGEAQPEPFILGNQYRTQSGELVRFVKVHNAGTSYESMEDEAGVNRYTRRDFGRCTGSAHDYSDPRNTPPLYAAPPSSDTGAQRNDEVLSALIAARSFIKNGTELGYIRMPDAYCSDPAHHTLPAIETAIAILAEAAHPSMGAGAQPIIEALKAAEKALDILWVSHHANRCDDALEKVRAALVLAQAAPSASAKQVVPVAWLSPGVAGACFYVTDRSLAEHYGYTRAVYDAAPSPVASPAALTDDDLFAILSEIADEEIMRKNRSSIIDVGRRIIAQAAPSASAPSASPANASGSLSEYSYQQLFNAISAAVKVTSGTEHIGISVEAFRAALAASQADKKKGANE